MRKQIDETAVILIPADALKLDLDRVNRLNIPSYLATRGEFEILESLAIAYDVIKPDKLDEDGKRRDVVTGKNFPVIRGKVLKKIRKELGKYVVSELLEGKRADDPDRLETETTRSIVTTLPKQHGE